MHGAIGASAVPGEVRIDGSEVIDRHDDRVPEMLARVEQSLNDLVQGLSLLGLKRCSWCKRFVRASDPGALFGGGREPVCLECVPAWWSSRREQLSCEDRKNMEGNLVFWLRNHHHARFIKGSGKPAATQPVKFELVASCLECRGTGTLMGDRRCRHCEGPGAVRVVVPQLSR